MYKNYDVVVLLYLNEDLGKNTHFFLYPFHDEVEIFVQFVISRLKLLIFRITSQGYRSNLPRYVFKGMSHTLHSNSNCFSIIFGLISFFLIPINQKKKKSVGRCMQSSIFISFDTLTNSLVSKVEHH